MATTEDVALAGRTDAFMRLMSSGLEWAQRPKLYDAYRRDGWSGVHDELLHMLRAALSPRVKRPARRREHRSGDREQGGSADILTQALRNVFQYQIKGYGLGRCGYVSADLPRGAKRKEIEEYEQQGIFPSREATVLDPRTAMFFGHFFLCASAKRVPQWCPEHSLAARQRQDRQKKLKAKRADKYI